jgi:hypothetical protein
MNFVKRNRALVLEVGVHLIEALRGEMLDTEIDAQNLNVTVEDSGRVLDLLCGLFAGGVC